MIKQVSIFAENKRGALQKITGVIRENNINIFAISTNDSAEFGIIRMIVSDPDLAKDALIDAGYQCKVAHVIGLILEDEVGYLDQLLKIIEESYININYVYLTHDREINKPMLLLHSDEPEEVGNCLSLKGYTVR
ncbi:MAG: ACT domain-containing protein [Eubacteriales bacterium]|nr:ACT domain-containing protein [Eubacteriales bacterium]